jgi:hypothetical protein
MPLAVPMGLLIAFGLGYHVRSCLRQRSYFLAAILFVVALAILWFAIIVDGQFWQLVWHRLAAHGHMYYGSR